MIFLLKKERARKNKEEEKQEIIFIFFKKWVYIRHYAKFIMHVKFIIHMC